MVVGSIINAVTSNKAGKAQESAANQASAVSRQNFLDGLEVIQPQIDSGNRARQALEFELGLAGRPVFRPDAEDLPPRPEITLVEGGPQYSQADGMPGDRNYVAPQITGFDVDRYQIGDESFTTKAAADNRLAALMAQYDADNPIEEIEYQGFQSTPGYQFRVDEGQKALDRALASRGSFDSGAALKEHQRFAQGIASNEYNNYLNRLASMSGSGQVAANNAFAGFQNQGNAAANFALQGGNARASSYIGVGNAINQGISNVTQAAGFFL